MSSVPPPPSLRALQVIVVAFISGVILSTILFIFLHQSGSAPAAAASFPVETLTLALGATAFGGATLMLFLPAPLIRAAGLRYRATPLLAERDAILMHTLSSLTIIRTAPIEGFGLLGAVSFLLTGEWAFLAAPALAVPLLAVFIPTTSKLAHVRERLMRDRA